MFVGSDRKLVNCNEYLCVLSQDNIALDNVEVEKLLGIHIDKNLSWSIQIDKICETISTRIYLLKRLKRYLPLKGLILFYNSYILPIIDYCCTVWGLTTHINLERIHKLQKRAARLVLSVSFDFPSTVMFKKLAWMTIFTRIHYFQAVLMFKCMNGLAPDYLSIKFTACADLYNYCLRSTTSGLLHVPRPNSDFFKRTFKYSGLITWNNLPNNIKEIDNLDTFKTNCSNYFLTEQNKDARN